MLWPRSRGRLNLLQGHCVNILEDLKKQAEKRRQDIEQSSQQSSGLRMIRSMQIVNGLQLIHSYLHEFIEQLNFVETNIRVSMPLDHFGTLENLQQGDYKLLYESSYNRELVCLFFSLNNDNKLEVEIPDEAGKATMEMIKHQGLLANFVSQSPARINIQGYVPVRIEFVSDFDEAGIHITIHNHSRIGDENYKFKVDRITDELLDELGRFILRMDNSFMDALVEDSQRVSMGYVQQSDTGDTGPQTEEMDASRLRSLFNREHRLYLTYHNVIKDIGSRTHGFILGRAKDCDLLVNSDLASRHHAQLVYRKGKFVLVDQSTNGTFVKPQGGKEVYVQSEALPLTGSGFISLGKAVSVDNEHLIYYSCQ